MKILLATQKPFTPAAVKRMRELAESEGYQFVTLENYKNQNELLSAVTDADALIVRSDTVSAEVLNVTHKLKLVVRAGSGYDNIDLKACTARGVVVMNTPGQNSNAVAELAFLMMLYMARSGFTGKWGTELRGKTIGLHGFGRVGRYMNEIAKGFGMTVFAFDPYVPENEMKQAGVNFCRTKEELYQNCQYVSLHIPLNDETRKSVGYDLLKLMPPEAVLINTARKEVIEEEGLLRIFAERPDFKYLSDIEPDNKPVFEEKYKGRFIFTVKKMGAQTEEANANAGIAAVKQIIDFFKTGNDKYRVN